MPDPAVAEGARNRMRNGTGTPADALTIINHSVAVARSYLSGAVGGTQNLSGDRLAGYCAMARDVTALSLASQLQSTGVPSTIRRYSVNGVAGRETGQSRRRSSSSSSSSPSAPSSTSSTPRTPSSSIRAVDIAEAERQIAPALGPGRRR